MSTGTAQNFSEKRVNKGHTFILLFAAREQKTRLLAAAEMYRVLRVSWGTPYTFRAMTLESTPSQSNPLLRKASEVAREVRESGGRALLVGGYVRDELLGLAPKDADVEVYGLEAPNLREMLRRFGKLDCVGESFRVYKLTWRERGERFELDVSLPRRDRKVGAGHKGFEVEGDPYASVEDAARRRDFTVNAMMRDPLTGELLDPFGGQADLQNRVLRMVDPQHFGEDSLRVLRAMQFAARFEMAIDPETVALCRTIDLSDLPKERIWVEWEKLLLKAEKPSLGLIAAHELGILEKLFSRLEKYFRHDEDAYARFSARNPERPHKQLAGHILLDAIDRAARLKSDLPSEKQITLMLAVIDSQLYIEPEPDYFVDRLGLRTLNGYDVRNQSVALADESSTIYHFWSSRTAVTIGDGAYRRIALRCDPQLLYLLELAFNRQELSEYLREKMQELGVWEAPPAPLLMGRHLLEMGLKPGKQIGEITRAVFEQQLDGKVTTLEEAQAEARRLIEEN